MRPDSSRVLSWGSLRADLRRGTGAAARDTLTVEATIQAFELGALAVPGLAFRDDGRASAALRRLPTLRLRVRPVIPAADTQAQLRPVRGPLAAPWWERVPWRWIAAAFAGVILVIVWVRARSKRTPPAPATAPDRAPDPATAALSRLEALRARRLPHANAFAEHAFELTAILRRYLEATARTPRPGDTTSDLVHRLGAASLQADEISLLLGLFRGWDRLKFARDASTVDEAKTSERAVEEFVRRRRVPPSSEAA